MKLSNIKLGKKGYIALAAVAGVTITTGLWAYGQYKKLLQNITGYKSAKIKSANKNNITIELVYTYANKMDIDVNVTNQKYDVYLDDIYAVTLTNNKELVLKANNTTDIPLTLSFDPKEVFDKLKVNPAAFLLNPGNVMMRIDMKIWVKLLFFSIPIKYSYQDKLNRMLGINLPTLK
jgi:LEA14-like dessication related protein